MLWWKQERILFQPPGHVELDHASADKVDFEAADGQALFGFLVGESSGRNVVLAFHGNADLAVWQLEWAAELAHRFGIGVFLAEYRGYGGIKGRPTYASSSLDADAAYHALTTRLGVPPDRIIFFGHSLGSAVATELAARHTTRALILQSPFTSAREMARLTVARPFTFVWKLVSRIHFDNTAIVRSLSARVSVIHGTSDLVIPPRMGEAVYRAAKIKGAFELIEKAGHNNVVEVAGESYWNWFRAALPEPIAE
ncbi:MAG: alpha/beta hydrolase [Gemmatimonadaceae bacterium]|nr:alpha/beta hydrolase [Gemmatimonadaceae bacterium]